jgi:hypothetical protein
MTQADLSCHRWDQMTLTCKTCGVYAERVHRGTAGWLICQMRFAPSRRR